MKGQIVQLTDGTSMEIKVNFGTMYYLQKCGGKQLVTKLQKKQKEKKRLSETEQMEFGAKVIYAMLRSNGKEVTFDEALTLMPADTDSMEAVINAYNDEVERIKKKEASKQKMKKYTQK